MQTTFRDYLSDRRAAEPIKRQKKRNPVVFQYKRSLALCISPEIAVKLGLAPAIYESIQELDGSKLIITFRQRQGGFET